MKRYILLFLLSFEMFQAFSQNISVSSFRLLETDLTANTAGTIEKDQNGEVCALIKVVTTQTGFSFDGGTLGIVKTIQKPAEIWVYVPRGLKKITISHPQLGIIRDYYLPIPVTSARTYELILLTGSVQTIINQDAGGQYLVMKVDPPSALVYIDDVETSLQSGSLSKFLPYGKHSYRVSDPLYTTDAGNFEIGKEKTDLNIKLQPSYGMLQIFTTPENGARVYLDNDPEPLGTTPFTTKKLVKGDHRFRFQLAEFETKTITHPVHGDGSTQNLTVPLIPNFSEITINVPNNADLYINGEKRGTGNWKGRLSEGMYRLEVRKDGYSQTSQNVNVVKGESQTINMPEPTPIYGGLNISSTPIGASIYIDGEKQGTTPEILNKVLIGKHTVRLELDGFESGIQYVLIEEGKIQELSIELSKKKESVNTPEKKENVDKSTSTSSPEILGKYKVVSAPAKSDGKVLKSILSSKSYKEAESLLNNNLIRLSFQDRATAYNKLVDLAYDAFMAQNKIQTDNQLNNQKKSVDNNLMSQMAFNAVSNGMLCDEYDRMINEKGKIAPRFRNKNSYRLWTFPRNQLVNAGQEAAQSKNESIALKYWGLFIDSDLSPLFAVCDRTFQAEFIGQIAYFVAAYAQNAGDNERAKRYYEACSNDPKVDKQMKNTAHIQHLNLMKEGLSTKVDSLRVLGDYKQMYAKNPNDDILLDVIYNFLGDLKDKAGQLKLVDDALSRNPNNFMALADKGFMLLEEKPAEACTYLKRAYDLKPDNAIIATYVGNSLSLQAEKTTGANQKKALYKEAIEYYDKAKEIDPDQIKSRWGNNRYKAYNKYYGPNSPKTKQAESESR